MSLSSLPSEPLPDNASILPSLGQTTTRGFTWVLAAGIVSKLLSLAGLMILGRYLSKDDFGIWSWTLTVLSFIILIRDSGPSVLLVQRGQHFRRWANAAFWMSLAQGILTGLVLLMVALLAMRAYRAPQLFWLLAVSAAVSPIFPLGFVPGAKLQVQLRFRTMTFLSLLSNTLATLLSIILALRGWGPWSLLIPVPAIAVVRIAISWWLAPTPLRWNPQFRRWRLLLGDTARIFVVAVCANVTAYGDNMILGLFHPNTVIAGVYFFAFSISTQVMTLLGYNLAQVLLPALSRLQHDRVRMTAAFLRAQRMLVLIGAPLCLLQAALAQPLIRLCFGTRWDAAIPVFQVLSLGTAIRMVGCMGAGSMLQAQARFALQVRLSVIYALVFLAFVSVGAWVGEAFSVAVAVSICFAILDTVNLYVAIRPGGGGWRDIVGIFTGPLVLSVFSVAAGLAAQHYLPAPPRAHNLFALLEVSAITLGGYVLGLRLVLTSRWRELVATIQTFRGSATHLNQ